ncbi:hypothetical protein FRC01_013629, partial [Tulasnella sp. 417]
LVGPSWVTSQSLQPCNRRKPLSNHPGRWSSSRWARIQAIPPKLRPSCTGCSSKPS